MSGTAQIESRSRGKSPGFSRKIPKIPFLWENTNMLIKQNTNKTQTSPDLRRILKTPEIRELKALKNARINFRVPGTAEPCRSDSQFSENLNRLSYASI